MIREKEVDERDHVAVVSCQGDRCSTWVKENLDAPNLLSGMLYELGKVCGAEGKVGKKPSSLIDNSPDTRNTRTKPAEAMQWEKEKKQDLGNAPSEVNLFSTSSSTNSPFVTELSGFEEDIPPSFEGQRRMRVSVVNNINMSDGYKYKGDFDISEQSNPEFVSLPLKKSSGPSLESFSL